MTRSLPLSLIALVCSAIARLSHAKEVQGDNWCGDLMCVTALVNTSTVTYQMTALNQLGWIAMGFGTQMADAKMVIMWPNTDGSVTLSQRTAPGEVEPSPDSNPPRVATLFQDLTNLSEAQPQLSFTVPKDDAVIQNVVWALGFENPMSKDPSAMLILHVDSGNFTLNLTKELDTDSLPVENPSQTALSPTITSGASSASPSNTSGGSGQGQTDGLDVAPLETFEKLIVAHAVICVAGFLVILPFGALWARWGRTFTEKWFYYHWMTQVVFSIPVVVIGWSLGPLAVAEQGVTHANDAHKICGILLFPLYFIQLCLGTFIHFRKPPYPVRHPLQNFVHGGLGVLIISLAFYQVRTGLTVEWTAVTSRTIDLKIFLNLWVAWAVMIPVTYFLGFFLLPRQLFQERNLPPPYSPRDSSSERGSPGLGVRRLLGLDPVDDGTHDMFSESASHSASSNSGPPMGAATTSAIEMREVQPVERWTPVSLASS